MDENEKNTRDIQPGDDDQEQLSDDDLEELSGGAQKIIVPDNQKADFGFWIRE